MTKLKTVMHKYRCSRRAAKHFIHFIEKRDKDFVTTYYGIIGVSERCKLKHA